TIPMGCADPERRPNPVKSQRRKLFVACLMLAAVVSTHSMAAQQGTRQYQLLRKPLLPQHPFSGNSTTEPLRHWNEIAINASGLDHTQPQPGDTHVFGEQHGPGRAARAMAIVHIAIFEALNAIDGKYESYVGLVPADKQASME